MKIAFNPSNSSKNILDLIKNNKDIIFDLKGHSIYARGVEFKGTDTNTWRPVVDNLTSNSATSSLSANQGRVLAGLINGKSDSDHNHDGRYLKLTGGTLTGNLIGTSAMFSGRFYGNGDDEGIIIKPSSNGYAGLILGTHDGERSIFYFVKNKPFWRYSHGSDNLDIIHPKKSGTIALISDIPNKNSWNYDDRYYTKAESNAKYITDIITSVNKLTFTKNGSNITRDITVNVVHNQGNLTNIPNKDATTKANSGLFIYNSYNQTIGTNSYSSVLSITTGGTIQIAGNWGDDQSRNLYWRSQSDRAVSSYPWKSWRTILDSENYSSTLDSRYYTESEVNSLLDAKLNRQNLSYGTWNPRGYNLAADYHYNGGDLSISESKGQIHVSIDGYFWQNEGQYRVLDTSDVAGLKGDLTVHQYLSNTDTTWQPLIWGGSSHANTSDSTGAVYKSHDVLSWQTSSQTLYATHLRTTYIDLENSRGIVRVASGGTSPYKGIKLPTLGADGIGMFSRFSNASDEGGIIISEDTSVIYNSFDTGWGLSVRDKDRGQTDISGDGTIAFGIRQDYRAYSLGGFEKSGSNNSYVLLGGGGHKLESSLNVANANTISGYDIDHLLVKRGRLGDYNIDHETTFGTRDIQPSSEVTISGKKPFNGWGTLLVIGSIDGASNHQLAFTGDNRMFIRCAYGTSNNYNTKDWATVALTSDNVASASKLLTTRSIWGQSFDGTRDVNGTIYINNSNSSEGAIRLNNNINSNARISAIDNKIIFNTGGEIRFGETDWNYDRWAGLKYTYSNKTIYLGIADGSEFTALSPKSNGTLKLPGITTITTNPGARIGNSGGDLYLGNANNNGWVKVQDICSHNGSDYWYIYQSGNAIFNYIKSKTNAYIVGNLEAGQIIRGGSSQMWVNGRNGALLRETSVAGYHALWSLKTTNGSWDFGEYNAGSDWNNIPVLSYITDSNYNSGNNAPTYQIKFPLASGTVALTSNILNPTNYYWANVKISTSSSTTTSPTVHTLTATRICAGHDPEIDNSISCSNWFRSSGNTGWYNTTYEGGIYMFDKTYIRTFGGKSFYCDSQISSYGFHHLNHDNNDAVLLAGGGYKILKDFIFLNVSYNYTDNAHYNLTFHKLSGICNNLVWVDGHVKGSISKNFAIDMAVFPYRYDGDPDLNTVYLMSQNNYISINAIGVVTIKNEPGHEYRVGFFYTGKA